MKKLGFGLMRLPQTDSDNYSAVDYEKTKKLGDIFMQKGFTYFDTAAPYHGGNSEVAFREAVVKRYPRESYTITDKLSFFMIKKAEDFESFFQSQLERLGVDYVDYYWLHGLGAPSYKQAEEWHAFDFVKGLKERGLVKHIGFSFHDKPELLEEILTAHPEMEYVQLQLNYLDWDDPSVESGKCYEVATRHHKPVIVMEPVKGGSLVNIPDEAAKLLKDKRPDMSIASWAIRFAASQPNVMMVLSGMNAIEQVEDNTGYMENFQPLSADEMETLEKAKKIIKDSITIPCTACRYCIDGCPKKIAIPDYFAIYNNLKRFGDKQMMVAKTYYSNLLRTHGAAKDCLKCGRCERRCPQHLPIRKYLEEVSSVMD